MSSPPVPSASRRKRPHQDDDEDMEPSSFANPPSSLPPSSPPLPPINDEDDEEEIRDDIEDLDDIEEELDGEDLMASLEKDYTQNVHLDRYDDEGVDDSEYEEMDPAERRAVEQRLARLDQLRANRKPTAFLDDYDDDELDLSRQTRRRRRIYDEDQEDDDMMGDVMDAELSLETLGDIKASSIADWIAQPAVHRTVAREFKSFLLEYVDSAGNSVYGNRIKHLGEINAESLEVSYNHLAQSKAILAYFLANAPTEVLQIFDTVAMETTLLHYRDYERIQSEIHVRISDLPMAYTLRELRQSHLNSLVRVSGVVTRRTGVFPQLKYVKFDCVKCGITLGPFQQESNAEVKISFCQNCQSRGPFTLNAEKTIYRNYQKITLQESPGTVPAGRLPRHREVILLWDLIDSCKPGEEVEITGIYKNNYDAHLNNKNGFPVFATILEANNVVKSHDQLAGFRLTEDDEKAIRALSRDEDVIDKIIDSIAPSIYGHLDIKTAVALSLMGGVPKNPQGKHQIRGDINVLLLGDPGTAKSQVLKYVEKTAHRAVFATGQGASAVGLTASVRKDPITREWTLEGGALVLADKGHCLIDEFDKMNDQDRTSIHEAMEQQSISISKAGIVTSLQARCAIIAAANPIGGRYNSTIPFAQNVELTEPILSRFDILCVVRDTVDPEVDERLANFVVQSHARSHPQFKKAQEQHAQNTATPYTPYPATPGLPGYPNTPAPAPTPAPTSTAQTVCTTTTFDTISPVPQDLLRKYILYARANIRPKLHRMDNDKIAKLFVDLRRESLATGSFPITVRHLESIIRISEAFAKMRLSEYVAQKDIDRAIAVTIESFVGTQKVAVKKSLARAFAKYTLPKSKPQKVGKYSGKAGGQMGEVRA
ncbi:MCM2/3/5 family-domain-containing protein [Kalaharituber pfeilii]|nr:MCM2/3/5 family-domain-containing protein [Kalaharituber pfeilii]